MSRCRKWPSVMSMWNWIDHNSAPVVQPMEGETALFWGKSIRCVRNKPDKFRALAQKGNVWDWPNPFRMLCLLDEKVRVEERRDCVRKAKYAGRFCRLRCGWKLIRWRWEELVLSRAKLSTERENLKENPRDQRQEALRNLIDQIENLRPLSDILPVTRRKNEPNCFPYLLLRRVTAAISPKPMNVESNVEPP